MNKQAFDEADKTLFRDSVRKFLETEVEPHYEEWEREEIWPREVWQKLGDNGLLCVDMPDEYGGYVTWAAPGDVTQVGACLATGSRTR